MPEWVQGVIGILLILLISPWLLLAMFVVFGKVFMPIHMAIADKVLDWWDKHS